MFHPSFLCYTQDCSENATGMMIFKIMAMIGLFPTQTTLLQGKEPTVPTE